MATTTYDPSDARGKPPAARSEAPGDPDTTRGWKARGPAASDPDTSAPPVAVREMEYTYPGGDFELRVPELRVETGERLAITGPSGSGKTTLLNLLAGILTPSRGSVEILGFRVDQLPDAERRDLRLLRLGLVFQEFELLEHLDALDNVLLPYRLSPDLTLDASARDRARTILRDVGLGDKLRRFPSRLSQGERQRVAVSRALITLPAIVLGDEPTGNLDADNRDRITGILFRYAVESGAPLVMVTHDASLLDRFPRRLDLGGDT